MTAILRILAGTLLVAFGTGILLDRLGVWEFGEILGTYWPLALIVVGGVQLVARSAPVIGSVLLLSGVFFQARLLGLLPPDWTAYVLPVVLILLGVALIAAPFLHAQAGLSASMGRKTREAVSEGWIERTAVLGGYDTTYNAEPFHGGTVTAVMGTIKLDLKKARITHKGAQLEINAVMGSVDLQVPPEWRIQMHGTPILGGIETPEIEPRDVEAPVLRIRATAILGSVEVHHPNGRVAGPPGLRGPTGPPPAAWEESP